MINVFLDFWRAGGGVANLTPQKLPGFGPGEHVSKFDITGDFILLILIILKRLIFKESRRS